MPTGGSVPWLPEPLLDLELEGERLVPRWLGERDRLWLEHLLGELDTLQGRSRAEVSERLRRGPQLGERPLTWRAAVHLMLRQHRWEVQACRAPREIRAALFEAAAAAPLTRRGEVIAALARRWMLEPTALERDLYADLPDERRLQAPAQPHSISAWIGRYNLILAQSLLLRAVRLRAELAGQLKAVLRFARLRRLLCVASQLPDGNATLELSGPLALFHHTTKYGYEMACWLPALVRAPRWRLRARCRIGRQERTWEASFRDAIDSTHAPVRRFDSTLERCLHRDLRRIAPRWEILREADPVQLGRRIVCPDFTLIAPDGRRVPVEIVGFWTPAYLRHKLALLHQLPQRWVICVDERLGVADEALPAGLAVFRFRRRIDARELLRFVERMPRGRGPQLI
jgi:predicted nuclease of restriction endonuclease-like RecB superfamily